MKREATAIACSNIALVKYWGKSERGGNLTAVPSLSLTLAALTTRTSIRFDEDLTRDTLTIDGQALTGRALERATRLLDELRGLSGSRVRAEIVSANDFPTASGLASSASGFAALALAGEAALGLGLAPGEVSRLSRRASASAARSVFGGYVELLAEAEAAEPVAAPDWLDVEMVIAIVTLGPKKVSSTDGMLHTQRTSPYYPAFREAAPTLFAEAKSALLARDLDTLGAAMEQSTLMMHASMLTARPSLVYLRDVTWRVMEEVRNLRDDGVHAFFTMDAGPHVKILVERSAAAAVAERVAALEGVERVLRSNAGPGARVEGI
jgi:diphosphomevalonate decarboxylase